MVSFGHSSLPGLLAKEHSLISFTMRRLEMCVCHFEWFAVIMLDDVFVCRTVRPKSC